MQALLSRWWFGMQLVQVFAAVQLAHGGEQLRHVRPAPMYWPLGHSSQTVPLMT